MNDVAAWVRFQYLAGMPRKPKPKPQAQAKVTIDADLVEWFKQYAEKHDRGFSYVLNNALRLYQIRIERDRMRLERNRRK